MDKENVAKLRKQGLTLQEIGNKFGVSRQRVFQILHAISSSVYLRKIRQDPVKLENYRRRKRISEERFRAKNPTKSRDYWRKHYLVVKGVLRKFDKRPRPDGVCEICDREIEMLHYHHWDDENPEWGIWVCRFCHFSVEFTEKGLSDKYNKLKEAISKYPSLSIDT